MKSKWLFVLAGASILILTLSSCGDGSGSGGGGGGGGGGTPPTCPTTDLQAPILTGPAMWSVVDSLSPSLTWSYPDATCNPQGYAIDLATGPFFTDDLGGGTGNPSTSWSPGSPLQPGKEYAWGVQAINGTTLGPYAGFSYFFTGPMCNTDALMAPTLLEPAYNAVVTELEPTLIWQYPDPCLPQGYRVDLSTDITFADTSLSGGTGNPSTRWGPGTPLADCTVYFWKITPVNGSTLGPASGIFAFSIDISGTCPTPTPVGPTPTPVPFVFTPNINTNCLSGPDTIFPTLEIALTGQPYLLDGRNLENTWFRILHSVSRVCWVPASSGVVSGDTLGLRVLISPPTPTPPTCSTYTNEESCTAQPACKWVPAITHAGGDCVKK